MVVTKGIYRNSLPATASNVDDVFSLLFNVVDLATRFFSLIGVITNLLPDVGTVLDLFQGWFPDTAN